MASRSGKTPASAPTSRPTTARRMRRAQRFLAAVARNSGLHAEFVFAAYEDAFYYLWRERRLPRQRRSIRFAARGPQASAQRLARLFEQGLDAGRRPRAAARAAMPSVRAGRADAWFLRRERCYLLPGDSPIGYRLPLDSLPWVAPRTIRYSTRRIRRSTVSASCDRRSRGMATRLARGRWAASRRTPTACRWTKSARSAITRTAMCAEPRNGVLYVFMPPTDSLEDYLELVAAVEARSARRCRSR